MRLGRLILLALSILSFAPWLHGQATRTWLSGLGDDANPCSRTAPCKTYVGAISKTAANGEINVMDPGSFGAVAISKSMVLSTDGPLAGIIVTGATNGVTVNNTSGSPIHVILRGLDLNGTGVGASGIRVVGSSPVNLHIVDTRIQGFTNGISVSTSSSVQLTVWNSQITDCVAGGSGINADGFGASVSVSLTNAQVHNCSNGVNLVAGAKFTAKNSDFSQNTTGVNVTGATTVASLDGNTIAFCTTAVNVATSGATVRLTNNTIVDNATGLANVSGGSIVTYGNNRIKANTLNGAPTANLVQN